MQVGQEIFGVLPPLDAIGDDAVTPITDPPDPGSKTAKALMGVERLTGPAPVIGVADPDAPMLVAMKLVTPSDHPVGVNKFTSYRTIEKLPLPSPPTIEMVLGTEKPLYSGAALPGQLSEAVPVRKE